MRTKKKHKWKYQINIKKKILVLIILGVSLFVSLGYALIESNLDIIGTLMVGQPFITVTFDADGGAVTPSSKNYVKNNYYTDLPTPTKQGYEFLGWNSKNLLNYNDLTNISSGDSGITVDTDGNISDNTPTTDDRGPDYDDNEGWRLELPQGTYTISLNFSQQATNGYSELKVENKEYEKLCSDSIANKDNFACTFELSEAQNLNILVKGYDGIYKVQLEEGNEATSWEPYYITNNTKVIQKDNHTLKAIWKVSEYTVTFNANGGSGGQSSNVTATYNEPMPTISTTAPTKSGYRFLGWYDDADYTTGTQYYDKNANSVRNYDKTNNIVLYAGWSNGLEVGDYFTLVPDEATARSSVQYISCNTPTADQSLWRVININNDKTVEAVSEYVSTNNASIAGRPDGYKDLVAGLQSIASKYAKSGYTIETRMFGFDGQTLSISDASEFTTTTSSTSTYSTPTPETGTGQEYGDGVFGDSLYLRDYQLVSAVYKTDPTTYGSSGLIAYDKENNAKEYFIASRYYGWARFSGKTFSARYIDTSGNIRNEYIVHYYSSWDYQSANYAVRPIITLKSGITIANGTGTKDDPLNLN